MPRIEKLEDKKLIGMQLTMSLVENKTQKLWQNFMLRRKEILNAVTSDLISLQVYDSNYFNDFNPNHEFEKWATVEVANFDTVPNGMEAFNLTNGLYAIFDYKGLNTDHQIFKYIFNTWIPNSEYKIDHRPHFEVLGSKYQNNDPLSEEEIWIPIISK